MSWIGQLFCAGVFNMVRSPNGTSGMGPLTDRDLNEPSCVEVGQFARASFCRETRCWLMCDEPKQYEHLMNHVSTPTETCYSLRWQGPDEFGTSGRGRGVACRLSSHIGARQCRSFFVTANQGPIVYRWQAAGRPPLPGKLTPMPGLPKKPSGVAFSILARNAPKRIQMYEIKNKMKSTIRKRTKRKSMIRITTRSAPSYS